MAIAKLLDSFLSSKELEIIEYKELFDHALHGRLNEAQLGAFLGALRLKGDPPEALLAGAEILRDEAIKPEGDFPSTLVDNCGTGGDGSHSFNISTAAALVASSFGIFMAKHGNRSVSSKCGSADLLFAAGYPDNLSATSTVKLLQKCHFAFFFAPHFHPAMKNVMPVRKALGFRTIFNVLGPLANPLSPTVQLLGVSRKDQLRPVAIALISLGVQEAMVVHSRDGLDEISPFAVTDGVRVSNQKLKDFTIEPRFFPITGQASDLSGGDPARNLELLHQLLDGKKDGIFSAVCLNAGAILVLTSQCNTMEKGYEMAAQALVSGKVRDDFTRLIETAKGLA